MLKFCFLFIVQPQIHPFYFDEAVNSGDYVTITCAVTKGDFPINISWTLKGLQINMFEGITVGSMNKRSSQLTIESAQAHHSGEYICKAKNLAGETQYSNYLNINGIYIMISYEFKNFFPYQYFPVNLIST